MKSRNFYVPAVTVLLVLFLSAISFAQEGNGPKSRGGVTLDELTEKRPVKPKTLGVPVKTPPRRKRTYKSVRAVKAPKPPKPATAALTDVGVTFWKLRPSRSGEKGHYFRVNGQDWVAARVGTDEVFKIGDRVRLAVESTVTGYLYVVDRETFADGTFGRAKLIFPESDDDNNLIGPGLLFDLPDQLENPPFYEFKRDTDKAVALTGDKLTIIVSPKRITTFTTDDDFFLKDDRQLVAMESESEFEVFTREDKDDLIYTIVESKAACGAKTRGLDGGKKKCGQLFRGDSAPQSLLRIKGETGKPAVAWVNLKLQT